MLRLLKYTGNNHQSRCVYIHTAVVIIIITTTTTIIISSTIIMIMTSINQPRAGQSQYKKDKAMFYVLRSTFGQGSISLTRQSQSESQQFEFQLWKKPLNFRETVRHWL